MTDLEKRLLAQPVSRTPLELSGRNKTPSRRQRRRRLESNGGHGEGDGGDAMVAATAILPEYLTTEELSGLIRVSVSSLTKWRLRGEGPAFVKMGARVVYRRADVLAYIEANLRRSTSEAA